MNLPTARPPSSPRRTPDLDSAQARDFVERAVSHPATPAPPMAGQGRAPSPPAMPASPRKEQLRPLTLRVPEHLHGQLLYIAENGSKSMNQFVIDALAPAVDAQIEKIVRRKELGLD